MRTRSAWIFECECGAHIESHEATGQCKECGRLYEFREWGVSADERH